MVKLTELKVYASNGDLVATYTNENNKLVLDVESNTVYLGAEDGVKTFVNLNGYAKYSYKQVPRE